MSGGPPLPPPAHQALAALRSRLGVSGGEVVVAWAPGRVNLLGEHTDYNDGLVLPVAVDRVVALAGVAQPAGQVQLYSRHHRRMASFVDAAPAEAVQRLPLWARLVHAVRAELREASPPGAALPGCIAAIAGNVPVGGGLSSSAALEVAVATLLAALGGPSFEPLRTAQLCRAAEERGAGVRIGIMDQATACLGRPGHALLLDCRSLEVTYVPVQIGDVVLAVFDTGVSRALARSGYNERRRECEQAVARLAPVLARETPGRQVHALRDVTAADLAAHGHLLPERELRRARHVVAENARVVQAAEALRQGDAARLGHLLDQTHASLRDDYQVSCPELDAAVEIATDVPGVLGARMMGAGFGGSALMLVRRAAFARLAESLARHYPPRTGKIGRLHLCQIAGGPAYARVGGGVRRGAP